MAGRGNQLKAGKDAEPASVAKTGRDDMPPPILSPAKPKGNKRALATIQAMNSSTPSSAGRTSDASARAIHGGNEERDRVRKQRRKGPAAHGGLGASVTPQTNRSAGTGGHSSGRGAREALPWPTDYDDDFEIRGPAVASPVEATPVRAGPSAAAAEVPSDAPSALPPAPSTAPPELPPFVGVPPLIPPAGLALHEASARADELASQLARRNSFVGVLQQQLHDARLKAVAQGRDPPQGSLHAVYHDLVRLHTGMEQQQALMATMQQNLAESSSMAAACVARVAHLVEGGADEGAAAAAPAAPLSDAEMAELQDLRAQAQADKAHIAYLNKLQADMLKSYKEVKTELDQSENRRDEMEAAIAELSLLARLHREALGE